ncbi:MAG: ATP-binding protein [Longimicrobiales bacterium]
MADLLERLSRAQTFDEACALVLDQMRSAGAFAAAALAVRLNRQLRLHTTGLDPDSAARLRTALSEAEPHVALADTAALLSGLGDTVCVIPFDAGAGVEEAVAIIDRDMAEPTYEYVGLLLDRCGPLLGARAKPESAGDDGRSQRQLDLLMGIVNALPDPVVLSDASNHILLSNRRAEQLFTSRPDDSGGRRRAIEINNLLFGSFLSQGEIAATEVRPRELSLVDPTDGSDLMIEVLSVPMPLAGRGARLSILRNITDLKRAVGELEDQINRSRAAEHRSRRERDQLNLVLENVTDPILVTDDQSNIILVNKEGERLFVSGRSADEQGDASSDVRANDTTFTTLISDFLLQIDPRRLEKLSLADPDSGKPFPAEVVSSKILNPRGEPTAIVSVVHDLTQAAENERLARELQELNDDLEQRIERATEQLAERNRQLEWQRQELEKASRLKSEFLANMSHELRTPINVVLGYTSLMRERIYGELSAQQEEALQKVYTTSQHLLELINDILDLSKIEAGKMPVHLEEVEITALIDELSEQIEPLIRRKSLRFIRDVPADLPMIRSDRTKLKQILLNLLSNAIKFTQDGHVSLRGRVTPSGQAMRITIADTGIGIKPENLRTIFEDFRQVDQTPTREYGGTGLGLSITKKLLSLLGGVISVESQYGEGSTFTIELPLRPDAGSVDDQVHRALVAEQTLVEGDASKEGAKSGSEAPEGSNLISRNVERTRDAVSRVVRRLGGK